MNLFFWIMFIVFAFFPRTQTKGTDLNTLRLVHVIFRHGDRKPDNGPFEPDANGTHTTGELTTKGKENAYLLGKWLQSRYGKLLEPYSSDSVESGSTYYERTKDSLQLVLQGLFSSNDLPKYKRIYRCKTLPFNNTVLVIPNQTCRNYVTFFSDYLKSDSYRKVLEKYTVLNDYLKTNANKTLTTLMEFLLLYDNFFIQKEMGIVLPDWAEPILPLLEKSLIDYFWISIATVELRQILMGGFIKNVIDSSTLKFINKLQPANRKMFLYSAHDLNVFCILQLFHYRVKARPPYNSCVMIEAHTIDNVHGFKVFYKDGLDDTAQPVVIPGCGLFCPLTRFVMLYRDYFPTFDTC